MSTYHSDGSYVFAGPRHREHPVLRVIYRSDSLAEAIEAAELAERIAQCKNDGQDPAAMIQQARATVLPCA